MRLYTLLLMVTPSLLYLMSAANPNVPEQEGVPGRVYLLGSFGTFALFGVALFGFGLGVALERSQGWTRTLRPAPISPALPFIAKLLVCVVFTTLALLTLLTVAALALEVRLPALRVLMLVGVMAACSVPLGALALALGSVLGANSAPLVMIVLYIFMSSISGIVVPMEMVARGNPALAALAPMWPTFHAGQLALAVVRPAASAVGVHLLALIGFTVLFTSAAYWLQRREYERRYG